MEFLRSIQAFPGQNFKRLENSHATFLVNMKFYILSPKICIVQANLQILYNHKYNKLVGPRVILGIVLISNHLQKKKLS